MSESEGTQMIYKEIESYDIKNNPQKVQCILTDNAHHFGNDLYILDDGNHFEFDTATKDALNYLLKKIQKILDKS